MVVVNCIGGVDATLKNLKKRMQQELRFKKIKDNRYFESPKERQKRRASELRKRRVKFARMMKSKSK